MPGIVAAVLALILAAASPAPSPNDVLYHALARLQSYGSPAYVVYTLDEDGTRRRVAFRARDSMMNDSEYPPQTTLPQAHIYHAFVGPLSYIRYKPRFQRRHRWRHPRRRRLISAKR